MKYRCCMIFSVILLVFAGIISCPAKAVESRVNRWEKAIQAFEALDRKSPPPSGGVLFIGSSSIRKWNLNESFPGKQYINRGFGGSQIVDSTHFAERIIFPYRPRTIVLYAGDNDIATGKSPRQVAGDFKTFAATVQKKLPKARIVFIAIKPSLARWELVDKMRQANKSIARHCQTDARLTFLDVDKPMLGNDGRPRGELFIADGLHLSPKGYKLWTSLLKPHLKN